MCCWMGVRSRGECWQSVAGGQKGGLYSVKSLSLPKEGTACWDSQGVHHHIHSFFGTHSPDVSMPTNTRTISQTPSVVCFFRWSAPRHRSPAWSCAGCSSSSQTLGCFPAPPQFSVAQAPAAKRHIEQFIIMTCHLSSDTMTHFCCDKRRKRKLLLKTRGEREEGL